MSKLPNFKELFNSIKDNDDYQNKARLMQYIGNVLKNTKKPISLQDFNVIVDFTVSEIKKLIEAIPKAENYEQKSKIFLYENNLLMVLTLSGGNPDNLSDDKIAVINEILELTHNECIVENAVDEMFELETIEKADIEKVLEIVKPLTDEYQRGILYQGLNEYKEKIKNLTSEAKTQLAKFVSDDIERLLKNSSSLDDNQINNLEFISDVCKYFIDERLLALLEKIMSIKINRIRYYALETLLGYEKEVSTQVIAEFAEDLTYAELTYCLLQKYGKENLFPKEYSTPEYLAKSDLVHWLTYPTELNKEPDDIQLLGTVNVRKELFHIFKYKSDSTNLSEDLQNEYLIGWSGNEGGTFSNFDKLSDFQKKTNEKTLKYIAKKLLK